MPPKAKSKDKGKAPQTQPTKPESLNPSAKLMSSAILAAKPIKSWYDAVVEEEETTTQSQVQTNSVQHWVDTLSNSPELLLALQKISQQSSSDHESPTGVFLNPFQNHKQIFLLKNPCLLYKLRNKAFPNLSHNTFSKLNSKIFEP